MTVWRDLRVEWMRLFRSKGTWLALLAASAAPLVGYGLYQPAGGGTTAALVLLNPMLAGALGGALAFAVLTLSEMNRVKKGRMGPLTDSVVSPLRMAVVRTAVLMLTAVVSSLVTSLLYLPYTWYRLGETFQGKEYVQVTLLFLLPFLEMTVLAAAAFYQIFQRVDVCVLLLLALLLVGLGPWSQDTYLLYWMDLSNLGFSGDLGNTTIFRLAWYSRLLWLCLFGGLWVGSLLCVRNHGRGIFGSMACYGRKLYLPLLAACLLVSGAGLYFRQPYLDHAPPVSLDTGNVTGGGTAYSSMEETEEPTVVIHKTQLELLVHPEQGTAEGNATYEVENISGTEQACLLDINPGYTVERILVNGEEVPFTDQHNDQFISLKNISLTLPAQKNLQVEISYQGRIQLPANTGVLAIYDEITPEYISMGGNSVLPALHGETAEDCTFTGRVTLPEQLQMVSKGKPAQVVGEGEGTRTWHLEGTGLRPAFFAGNYVCVKLKGTAFPVYFWYSATHQTEFTSLGIERLLTDTVSYCTAHYGALPYTEEYPLNIVMTSAHMMGGGAADNLSYMAELFFSEDNLKDPSKGASAEEVIAHEIVHQWWGSQCPIMDLENTDWSAEALTCYTTYRMMKEWKGADYAQQFYVDQWQTRYDDMMDQFYLRNPQYISRLSEEHQASIQALIFDASTYGKAPLQVKQAETLVGGEAAMDAILQTLFQQGGTEMPPYVTWQDFLDACGLTEDQLAVKGGHGNG